MILKSRIFKIRITFKNGTILSLKLHGIFKNNKIRNFLSQQYFQVKINGKDMIFKTEEIFSIEII